MPVIVGGIDATHFETLNAWLIIPVSLGWWVHATLSIISHKQGFKYQ